MRLKRLFSFAAISIAPFFANGKLSASPKSDFWAGKDCKYVPMKTEKLTYAYLLDYVKRFKIASLDALVECLPPDMFLAPNIFVNSEGRKKTT